jgi:hypothetical protein
MGLILPDEGASLNVWAPLLDAAFGVTGGGIDAHDHTSGKGVKIAAGALNINGDVSWSSGGTSHSITDVLAIDFKPGPPTGVSGLAGALFISDGTSGTTAGELYYRTMLGSNVQVTLGAALNVAAFAGGIGGDYISAGALEVYDAATLSYWLQQPGSPRPWASLRVGNVDVYQAAASIVNRVRIQSPNALAASYAIVLPTALPAAKSTMQIDSAGQITAIQNSSWMFPASLALPQAAAIVWSGAGTNLGWDIGNSSSGVECPIALPIGAVITSWTATIRKSSAASSTISAALFDRNISAGTASLIGVTQVNSVNNPGFTTMGQSGLSTTVSVGHTYHISISESAAAPGLGVDFMTGWQVTT